MYARLITFTLEPGMQPMAERLADRFAPLIRAGHGLVSVVFFTNKAAGEYGALIIWESKEDVEAEATIVIPRLQDALASICVERPLIRLFDVYKPRT